MNRSDRRAAAKMQRRCPHHWVWKDDYPEIGVWCFHCGKKREAQ